VVMSDYLRMTQADPDRVARRCAENNVSPRRVGQRLMFTFYRQLFEDNLFHGDLHPGNIILLRDSRFALIDFGTIGNLERRFLQAYRDVARATAQKDYSKAVELYLLMCDRIPAVDLASLRADMVECYRAWEARVNAYGTSYMDKAISGAMAFKLQDIAALPDQPELAVSARGTGDRHSGCEPQRPVKRRQPGQDPEALLPAGAKAGRA